MTGVPKKDPLEHLFEKIQTADIGRRRYEAKSALSSKLYDAKLVRQIMIAGTPTYCAWGDYSKEAVRKRMLEGRNHSPDDGLIKLKLVGGTVLGTINNNFVWVVAAKPSQLKENPDVASLRGWGISYDDIKQISYADTDPRKEVEVIDEAETIRLTAIELYEREIRSNVFWHGDPFGPRGRSDAGYGAPC